LFWLKPTELLPGYRHPSQHLLRTRINATKDETNDCTASSINELTNATGKKWCWLSWWGKALSQSHITVHCVLITVWSSECFPVLKFVKNGSQQARQELLCLIK
jgi:hypothetical protein